MGKEKLRGLPIPEECNELNRISLQMYAQITEKTHFQIIKKFRENWWKHYCYVLGKVKWIHKQYKSCDKCGMRAKNPVIKGTHPL